MTLPASGADASSLAARMVAAPVMAGSAEGPLRLRQWLDELAAVQREPIEATLGRYPKARAVLEGIAEFSPYLFDLVRRDAARLHRLLHAEPSRHAGALLAQIGEAAFTSSDEPHMMRLLRTVKAEASLLIAMCDIGEVWPVMRVTDVLSELAGAAVRAATRFLLLQETARGRFLPADAAHPEIGSGLIILAMGKMGAGELNYSSDIDLIAFFDPGAATLRHDIDPQPFFVRLVQGLTRLLQQRTADGYVFRVDLRLRPDPASTPVAVSTGFALGYYEREGRTWERAAMIKASPCAGDLAAGRALLADISPFIWRKHLDFAALADIHDLKRQMYSFKGHSEIAVEGHNIKQGRGGIREIEFFVQTQQLIAGGRHPQLRTRRTLEALDALAENNWITTDSRDQLCQSYRFLRRLEHRLQMIADEQTHTLPEERPQTDRFARFFGYANRDTFATDLLHHLRSVQEHYSKLFESDPTGSAALPPPDYKKGAANARLLEQLAALGFKRPVGAAETLQRWASGEYRSLRGRAAQRNLVELVPLLLTALGRSDDPDSALINFDHFLQSLRRGGRLLSLLQQNSDLISLLALILASAPRLGDMIARQPQIVDGLVDQRFFGAMPQREEIAERLRQSVVDADGYEDFLDRLRLFGQEGLFLIGSRILTGTISASLAGGAFADVAEGIVQAVHALVLEEFVRQYGTIKDQRTAIVAMGRFGSREMTASSDLDLILIYDFDQNHPESDGRKSLHGPQYFARLTQRLIGAFTTQTNYGSLYDIDMRLRPSGRAGPVATSLAAFHDYQRNDAWTWEHMALTRARVISAPREFSHEIEAAIRGVLTTPRDRAIIANDVFEMRKAIAQEKGDSDPWDLKNVAGGIIDVEFIAQYLQLVHASERPDILSTATVQVLEIAARQGMLARADADVLRGAMRLYQDLNQILRLCLRGRFQPENAGAELPRLLARAGDEPEFSALQVRLGDTQALVREIFQRLMERWGDPARPA